MSEGATARPVVAGCGAIAVDQLLFLDRAFSEGKGKVLRREVAHGGNIATALAAVRSIGGGARWLGYLPEGASTVDLEGLGVDLSSAHTTATAPILSSILVDPMGERFIAFDDDTLLGMPADAGEPDRALSGVDTLLVDSYAAENGLDLVKAAVKAGVHVVADIERLDFPRARDLFDIAPHLVIPLEIGQSVTGAAAPLAVAEQLWNAERVAVVLTDGADGSWYLTRDGRGHTPAFSVRVVDTSGCGDVFHGIYALRLAERRSVEDAILHASAAAAVCATAAGGRGHLPTEKDLEELLAL